MRTRRRRLHKCEFDRMRAGEDALHICGVQPIHALEQSGKHRAVIGQYGIVAVLEQMGLINLDLLAMNEATVDAAAQHPIDAAMAMIGATIAILTEGEA